ncbi:MAG TPA: FKBP-type peptidyl-prolyl cis-trans isomerase [Gemmatimonadaceae bacterium]|nr:FKBP-type peptidyl-prolyl cis-trans isomerase [Gemmatimonadaceae bacterium]
MIRVVPLIALAAAAGCFPDKLDPTACKSVSFTTSISADTVTTSTGLKYVDGTIGSGPAVAWCHNIAVHYEAYLSDGTQFDESRSSGVPLVFAPGVGSLIDGLEQGVIGMRGGSTRRLIIPPQLGFGSEPRKDEQGNVIVPANSTVIFDVEIIEVQTIP